MGNFTSQPPASQPEPEREYFTDAGKSYFGPNFIVHPATSNSSNPSAHFLDPKNLLWSDIWSTVATGRALTLKQLEEFGNPYTSKNAQATTLQSLTNLKKTSFKISNNDSIQKIEFSFDSSTPCLVRIYQNVKEVVVVDTRTGTSVKNIVFRSFDNSTPKLSTFGPFNHGLNQKFSQELHLIDSLPMIPTSTTIAAEGGDSSPGKMEPQNETQSSQEQLFTIQLFPLIIVLESIVPSLIEGLEKAAKQGMPNPVNSQSTYINYSIINDSISDLKVLKQRVLIDNVSYLLQEIFGFLDESNEDAPPLSETRDCVICMSEPRDTVVLPCRHLCLCKDCAELLRSQGRQLPATATVGQVPNVAVQNAATPTQIAETPPAQPSLISTIFNPAPVGSTARTVLGAPKCPICRQVFHSLLQINLPAPAVGIDRSAGSSTRINIS